MRGISLAGGAGTRFNGAVHPKCLVTFDERTLISIQLSALRPAGLRTSALRLGAPGFKQFARTSPIYAIGTRGLPWTEIDTADGYRHGIEHVYPAIRDALARSTRMAVGA
jgi:GTP:adenosylcobinamide-phosphate guanylyltransferase